MGRFCSPAPRMLVKSIRFCRSQASYRGVAFLALVCFHGQSSRLAHPNVRVFLTEIQT
jgi:hypothetical protein